MATQHDGPASALFQPLHMRGTLSFKALATAGVSLPSRPSEQLSIDAGRCVCLRGDHVQTS